MATKSPTYWRRSNPGLWISRFSNAQLAPDTRLVFFSAPVFGNFARYTILRSTKQETVFCFENRSVVACAIQNRFRQCRSELRISKIGRPKNGACLQLPLWDCRDASGGRDSFSASLQCKR